MDPHAGQAMAQTIHAAVQAHGEAHELPNLLTILSQLFPKNNFFGFLYQWENIVFSLLIIGFVVHRFVSAARKKEFLPKNQQNCWEIILESLSSFVTGILGPKGIEYVPFLGTLFIYILLENWFGLIPLMKSPTSGWSTTIALALIATVYVQYVGIKEQGFWHYLKHMAGDPKGALGLALLPLMLIINVTIEYLAVPLSLSLRLFANISSEDRLLYKFAELNVMYKFLPIFFQLFANILAIIFSLVQAFVFLLLTTVYISLVMPREEHGHSATAHGKKIEATHQPNKRREKWIHTQH